jgi:hypothetical protein
MYRSSSKEDFWAARRRADWERLVSRLARRPTQLRCYDEVLDLLVPQAEYQVEDREVAVADITGSVGRCSEFTRSFLPLSNEDERRWSGIRKALSRSQELPPVHLYQIGQWYFVADGHHRVSVARQLGLETLPARVMLIQTRVPLSPEIQPDELEAKAAYASFLARMDLDETRPQACLEMTVPEQYEVLQQQIEAHRLFLIARDQHEVRLGEAAASWYDRIYEPMAKEIRASGVLADFPARTEADLYVWLYEHRMALEEVTGLELSLEMVAADLAAQFSPRPQASLARLWSRVRHVLTLGGRLAPPHGSGNS